MDFGFDLGVLSSLPVRTGTEAEEASDGLVPRPGLRVAEARLLDSAIAIMHERVGPGITLDDLVARLGCTPHRLRRVCRLAFGLSPYRLFMAIRVERAKSLLTSSECSVGEIALRCGFSHAEHLGRAFRQHYGLPPGRFRRASPEERRRW